MSTKISKAEFDALPDALKAKFEANGESYVLQEEDVEGLKKSKAEILTEKKRIQDERDELAKFKADKEAESAKSEQDKLAAEGKWKELEQKMRDQHAKELADRETKIAAMFQADANKQLAIAAAKHGVFEDMAEDFSDVLRKKIKPVDDGGKVVWKSLDDAQIIDLDTYVPSLSANGKGRYFKASGASGSGALGSQQQGGQAAKTMTRAQWDASSPAIRSDFSKTGGTVTD